MAKYIFVIVALFASSSVFAQHYVQLPPYSMQQYDQVVNELYSTLWETYKNPTIDQKIIFFSHAFLNKPYVWGALGEGPNGIYDQNPLYRTDQFDCLTYVSTVLALAQANSLEEFKKILPLIQYENGEIGYTKRNHFTSLDWNKNNEKQGFITDVTRMIHDKAGHPIAVKTVADIDKKNWYAAKKLDAIKQLVKLTDRQQQRLLDALRHEKLKANRQKVTIWYIPLVNLFNEQGEPNHYLFDQIPDVSIIEIVRPDWNMKEKIGTNLHVSHVGFALRTANGLIFREASLSKQKVTDSRLSDYLHNYLNSPTVKGIHIQAISAATCPFRKNVCA